MFHFSVFFTIGPKFPPSQLCQNPFIARTLFAIFFAPFQIWEAFREMSFKRIGHWVYEAMIMKDPSYSLKLNRPPTPHSWQMSESVWVGDAPIKAGTPGSPLPPTACPLLSAFPRPYPPMLRSESQDPALMRLPAQIPFSGISLDFSLNSWLNPCYIL